MKKTAIVVAVSVLAVLMVLPVVRSVNLSAGKPITNDRTLSADGWPLPIPHQQAETLVADGWPVPPFPPSLTETLVADGWPVPPFPPQSAETLVSA